MSVFRVITRIIPLSSSESTFEPASFDQLTDGRVGEIKVLNLTEPQSGMKYRIERIEYVENVGPGESVESLNKAYAEKLKTIPGFVQFKSDDLPLNPYDKSFQITLPKVLSGQSSTESSTSKSLQKKSSESFKISVVKNFNFNKSNFGTKKSKKQAAVPYECRKVRARNGSKLESSECPAGSETKRKYPIWLIKKCRYASILKKNNLSFQTRKRSKSYKSYNYFKWLYSRRKGINSKNRKCPPEGYMKVNEKVDNRKTFNVEKIVKDSNDEAPKRLNLADGNQTQNVNGKVYSQGDSSDNEDFLEIETGDLIINVPDVELKPVENEGDTSECSSVPATISKSALTITKVNNGNIKDDSSLGNSVALIKFIIPDGHPAKELLIALKKYFVNGECLICGFIPNEAGFNGFEHMQLHTLSNSFTSSYKCSCCDEKFSNPRNLYMHALSREKTYKYMCDICLLKFKRKHYLSRHTAKSH